MGDQVLPFVSIPLLFPAMVLLFLQESVVEEKEDKRPPPGSILTCVAAFESSDVSISLQMNLGTRRQFSGMRWAVRGT